MKGTIGDNRKQFEKGGKTFRETIEVIGNFKRLKINNDLLSITKLINYYMFFVLFSYYYSFYLFISLLIYLFIFLFILTLDPSV